MARQFLSYLVDTACFNMNSNEMGEEFEEDGVEEIIRSKILDKRKMFSKTKFETYIREADYDELKKVFDELENFGMSLSYLWEYGEIDKDDIPLSHLMIGYKIKDDKVNTYKELFREFE